MRRLGAIAGIAGLILFTLWGLWEFLYANESGLRRGLLWLSILLLLAGVVTRRREIFQVMRGRRMRIGAQSVIYTLVVAVSLLLLNFVSARHRYRVDLTESGAFSLTPVSERVLERVTEPVKIIGFFTGTEKTQMRAARATYRLYADANPRIEFEVVDPLRNPDVPTKYGITGSGITLVECGERVRSRGGFSQTTITNLIASVSGGNRRALFMGGSGMRDPTDRGPAGYSRLARVLGDALFEVNSRTFTPGERLDPDELTLVILPGPKEVLAPFEVEMLQNYLLAGGKVLAFADPHAPGLPAPLQPLGDLWGLSIMPGVLAQVNDADIPWQVYATDFGDAQAAAPVRRKMAGRRIVFDRTAPLGTFKTEDPRIFSGALVPIDPEREPVFLVPEVRPGRPNPDGETLPFPDEGVSLVSFAYRDVLRDGRAVGVSRLALMGDADFGDNYGIDLGDNRRFLSALVSWLTGEELVVEEEAGETRRAVAWVSYRRPIVATLILPPFLIIVVGAVVLGWRRWR